MNHAAHKLQALTRKMCQGTMRGDSPPCPVTACARRRPPELTMVGAEHLAVASAHMLTCDAVWVRGRSSPTWVLQITPNGVAKSAAKMSTNPCLTTNLLTPPAAQKMDAMGLDPPVSHPARAETSTLESHAPTCAERAVSIEPNPSAAFSWRIAAETPYRRNAQHRRMWRIQAPSLPTRACPTGHGPGRLLLATDGSSRGRSNDGSSATTL